jgi:hypothetical protein
MYYKKNERYRIVIWNEIPITSYEWIVVNGPIGKTFHILPIKDMEWHYHIDVYR